MCGIFGVVGVDYVLNDLTTLARHAQQRGRDSSGLFFMSGDSTHLHRASFATDKLIRLVDVKDTQYIVGHSRLITNGLIDNQPVMRDSICVIHNGIVVNHEALWKASSRLRKLEIDTEIICALAADFLDAGGSVEFLPEHVLSLCDGVVACAVMIPRLGKICLFSNNGSLYLGQKNDCYYFSSERFPLTEIGCVDVNQVRSKGVVLDVPACVSDPVIVEHDGAVRNLIPKLVSTHSEEGLLEYRRYSSIRCTKCVLPSTMPYIRFDAKGVCNFCTTYKPRNRPRPVEELFSLVESYRRVSGDDCLVPFSGGRDSCYGLHLIARELKMKPITYTYDWGMVTDLGRRNISRMCARLGVENIIVADNIGLKRQYIAKNFAAWLKAPHLGMVSILTAGDKHFFRHIETVKMQTGISLNLWGVNPLEVTHFKAGFLGIPPDFEEEMVYSSGAMKQFRYQWLRFRAMLKSPGYFNSSILDTLSGEYYRSFHKKSDYFHIFDFWRWDEKVIDQTLRDEYDWERAPDTNTTWRIGDGTAAIYNYIYYTVAGFSEHDTFRSNQIREGDITREQALVLIEDENRPRYPNIKWYLDAIGMDFSTVIRTINSIPKLAEFA